MDQLQFADFNPVGRKAVLLLNQPPLNILHQAMCEELTDFLEKLSTTDFDCLLITTKLPHFSAGADIEQHLPDKVGQMLPRFDELLLTLAEFPLPTVAAITGSCLGGGLELARACDLVIAWNPETVVIGQPEIKLACFPPFALASFPRLRTHYPVIHQDYSHLIKFLLTGRILKGNDPDQFLEAYALGLINGSFSGTLEKFVEQFDPFRTINTPITDYFQGQLDLSKEVVMCTLATEMEAISKLSNHALKLAIGVLICCSRAPDLRTALEYAEHIYLTELVGHSDYLEGLAASMAKPKRQPVFERTGL